MFPTTLPTKGEEQVREAMIQMWVDFARTGYDFMIYFKKNIANQINQCVNSLQKSNTSFK